MNFFSTHESDMRQFVCHALGERAPESHKGQYGNLLCLCGSTRYRGAAQMAVRSALRCGVGLLRLASVEPVIQAVAVRTPECICVPMRAGESGGISAENLNALYTELKASTAVLAGCGMIRCTDTQILVEALLQNAECPVVLDADALNVLSGRTDLLSDARCAVIVTPHPGEMARLTGIPVAEIESNREAVASHFAKRYGCVTVLKGHRTCVASPDGRVYRNETGNPGLARGGSGDCLAGMIGAFCARGIPLWEGAVSAVYLHGLAADRCAGRLSMESMLPSDLEAELCTIFREWDR